MPHLQHYLVASALLPGPPHSAALIGDMRLRAKFKNISVFIETEGFRKELPLLKT
jgi:hypothetical protein